MRPNGVLHLCLPLPSFPLLPPLQTAIYPSPVHRIMRPIGRLQLWFDLPLLISPRLPIILGSGPTMRLFGESWQLNPVHRAPLLPLFLRNLAPSASPLVPPKSSLLLHLSSALQSSPPSLNPYPIPLPLPLPVPLPVPAPGPVPLHSSQLPPQCQQGLPPPLPSATRPLMLPRPPALCAASMAQLQARYPSSTG